MPQLSDSPNAARGRRSAACDLPDRYRINCRRQGRALKDGDHEDARTRQPRFSFKYLPCHGTSEKSSDALSAPNHTQPGGFIIGTGFFIRFRSINRDDRRAFLPARAKFLGSEKVQSSTAFVYNFRCRNILPKHRERGRSNVSAVSENCPAPYPATGYGGSTSPRGQVSQLFLRLPSPANHV